MNNSLSVLNNNLVTVKPVLCPRFIMLERVRQKLVGKSGLFKRSSASILVSVMVDDDEVGSGQDLTLCGAR